MDSFLGGIKRNSTGHIVAAEATILTFYGSVNVSGIDEDELQTGNKGQPVIKKAIFYKWYFWK